MVDNGISKYDFWFAIPIVLYLSPDKMKLFFGDSNVGGIVMLMT